jgi:predicted nucleic acid-binding protein
MIYFDSTILVKLHTSESDSARLLEFVLEKDEALATSITCRMEVVAALHRKYREGAISKLGMMKAHDQFIRDMETGRIVSIAFSHYIVDSVERAFLKLPATIFLRTGDAIHLATAAEAGFKEIYSNDKHLLAAAPIFKLKGINPLAK